MNEQTAVIPTEFKDKPMFSIFIVDENGNKKEEHRRPVLNMGIKKAQFIITHLKELEAFVLENS